MIADLGVNFVERQILLAGHTADSPRHDYGFDLMMMTYAENGEVENGCIWIQVKATNRISARSGGRAIPFALSSIDLNLWLFDPFPVMFALYEASSHCAWWVDIQQYVDDAKIDIDEVGATVTIRIPVENRLDPAVAGAWRIQKNERIRTRTDGGTE